MQQKEKCFEQIYELERSNVTVYVPLVSTERRTCLFSSFFLKIAGQRNHGLFVFFLEGIVSLLQEK